MVDDGSRDETREIARSNGVIVISHKNNLGKGASVRIEVENARGDIIIFLDGDGAHNPQDIPRVMASIIEEKTDLVIGSRALPESIVQSFPFTRRPSNSLASFVITVIISLLLPSAMLFKVPMKYIKATDCTSGFRAIKREAWQKLHLVSQGFQIETDMIYEAARNRLTISEAPISCDCNSKMSHLSMFKDGLMTLKLLAGKLVDDLAERSY